MRKLQIVSRIEQEPDDVVLGMLGRKLSARSAVPHEKLVLLPYLILLFLRLTKFHGNVLQLALSRSQLLSLCLPFLHDFGKFGPRLVEFRWRVLVGVKVIVRKESHFFIFVQFDCPFL